MGLAYLHSIGVDNRELNLNNKLLTGDKTRPLLKINDFTYRRAAGPSLLAPVLLLVGCMPVPQPCRADARGVDLAGGAGALSPRKSKAPLLQLVNTRPSLTREASPSQPVLPAPTRAAQSPDLARTRCFPRCSKSEQINSDPNSALGSLPYTAPEVLSNTMRHGHQADVWSLGVALYKMGVGRYPFERPEDAADARTAVQVGCCPRPG